MTSISWVLKKLVVVELLPMNILRPTTFEEGKNGKKTKDYFIHFPIQYLKVRNYCGISKVMALLKTQE